MTEAIQRWLTWHPQDPKYRATPENPTDKTDKTPSEASCVSFGSAPKGSSPDISAPGVPTYLQRVSGSARGCAHISSPLTPFPAQDAGLDSTGMTQRSGLIAGDVTELSTPGGATLYVVGGDEDDVRLLIDSSGGKIHRGHVWTKAEVRALVEVGDDPEVLAEIRRLKQTIPGSLARR